MRHCYLPNRNPLKDKKSKTSENKRVLKVSYTVYTVEAYLFQATINLCFTVAFAIFFVAIFS